MKKKHWNMNLASFSRKFGLNYATLYRRILSGLSADEAAAKPLRTCRGKSAREVVDIVVKLREEGAK